MGLLLMPRLPHDLAALGPDPLTLLPFIFFQIAVSELLGEPLLPRLSLVLLAVLIAADVLYTAHEVGSAFRIAAISLAVGFQCIDTAMQLSLHGRERKPNRFCVLLLWGFGGYNLLRAVLVGSGLARRWHIDGSLFAMSILLYLAVGLGLAFGFFWMTNARLERQLEELAGTDPLTRVYNRRAFLRACDKEVRAALRRAKPFSILMADLDHFKRINDRFGHEAGDQTLIAVVEQMQDSIRGIDVLGRWGGEEFVVLLPNANEEAARTVAERMRVNVERAELPVAQEGHGPSEAPRITVSIGAATFQPHDDLHALLRRADECLYQAKDAGRNRVLLASQRHDLSLTGAA